MLAVRRDRDFAAVVDTNDLGLTFEHDDEVGSRITGAVQDVALGNGPNLADCFELLERALVEKGPRRRGGVVLDGLGGGHARSE